MPAYLIGQITVRDAATYERYKQLAPPSIGVYGGRYVARGGATETLEGSWRPPRLVILEFPSIERTREWWNSPEYAAAKALRQTCADTEMLVVDGLSEAASAALAGAARASATR